MKFLSLANKLFKNINGDKKSGFAVDGTEVVDNSKSKFPLWLLGGSFGCLGFAVAAVFIVIIGALIHLDIIDTDVSYNGSGGGSVTYDSSCDYEATNVTVMNLHKTEVLATVSLEDYIIGVSCVEISTCGGGASLLDENYVKSQFVASKTYVLERGGYSMSDKSITIRSSTADQGWCDLERGCYTVEEVYTDGNTYQVFYPGSDEHPPTKKFTEEDLTILHKWYDEIYGELFITDNYSEKIQSLPLSGSVSIAYKATTQNFWQWFANQGSKYDTILVATANPSNHGYNESVADTETYAGKSIYELSTACPVSSGGSYAGLDTYPLNGGDATSLSVHITDVLSDAEIEHINNSIIRSVDEAGRGTGDGVAAGATALLMGLYEKGIYLPYYWGGGHGSTTIGVDRSWGTYSPSTSSGGNVYNYVSFDCSGFVSWAVRNGACPNYGSSTVSGFYSSSKVIDFNDLTPGDVLVKRGSHIILVVKNNGDGSVVTAESTTSGVVFRIYTESDLPGYESVDLEEYYSNSCEF